MGKTSLILNKGKEYSSTRTLLNNLKAKAVALRNDLNKLDDLNAFKYKRDKSIVRQMPYKIRNVEIDLNSLISRMNKYVASID